MTVVCNVSTQHEVPTSKAKHYHQHEVSTSKARHSHQYEVPNYEVWRLRTIALCGVCSNGYPAAFVLTVILWRLFYRLFCGVCSAGYSAVLWRS
jgi:hypothetical protein